MLPNMQVWPITPGLVLNGISRRLQILGYSSKEILTVVICVSLNMYWVSATVEDVSGENIQSKVKGLTFSFAGQPIQCKNGLWTGFPTGRSCTWRGGWSIDLCLWQVRTLRLTQCPMPFALPSTYCAGESESAGKY